MVDLDILGIILFSLFLLLVIIVSHQSIKVVNHAEVMIVERFGSYHMTLLPGLHFVVS